MKRFVACCVCSFIGLSVGRGWADEPGRKVDYLRDIKPIFQAHCIDCHGTEQQEAGLRLDSADGILQGGDSGPALVAGKSGKSRLILAVTGADDDISRMPPEGPELSKPQVALLRTWVDQGAPAPRETAERVASDHWSFQPLVCPDLPDIQRTAWVRNPIDVFVLARLEQARLGPSPEASREMLIRRLSFDLLGLPPSYQQVEAFVKDPRPDAYRRLVDRLLASPAFGQRWGRHWLDIARYADSNGYTRDFAREIWKYRDWVIAALNRDLPFDQFTIEQIAGDMLADATLDQRIATGFHRNTLINEEGGTDQEQFRVDAVADRVATTGAAFLGLTLGCARCHQHKYDPISQREYYQMFAFLNNCDEPTLDAPDAWQIERGDLKRRAEIRKQIADLEQQLEQQRDLFLAKQLEWEKTITPEQRAKLPGPVQASLDLSPEKRDETQKKLVADLYKATDAARQAFPLVAELAHLRHSQPTIPTTMVLRERSEPRVTHVHRRGNFLDLGARVRPDVPAVLHPLPDDVTAPNRLDFARWLVAPENPLTPRVVVNRYWQRLFGRGIVETENDFGAQGTPPTHPQLLDWLAAEMIRRQWSTKDVVRLIVTSATYRQDSRLRDELTDIDPQNKLLARQSRVRLEAEIVRDAALTAAGLLDHTLGGPSVYPPQPEGVFQFTQDPKPWNTETAGNRYRRGMYTYFWRSSPYPALMVFDFPNSNVTCTRRIRSNTPLQSLTLANDITFVECARALAERVLAEAPQDEARRVEHAFRLCLARSPTVQETERLLQLVRWQREIFAADWQSARQFTAADQDDQRALVERAAWTALARVLINLDEFITRE